MPSANERAKKSDKTPSYYTNLFTSHPECFIEKRAKETKELCQSPKSPNPNLVLKNTVTI